jgi:hypothetical protein
MDTIYALTATGTKHDYLHFDHTLFADAAHVLGSAKQVGADIVITADPLDTVTVKNTLLSNLTASAMRVV